MRWSLSTGHWQLAARCCCAEFGSRSQTGLTGSRSILALRSFGELPAPVQVKLLRLEIRSDARVLAATNRNLQQSVAGGRFREGLYFRLAGVTVKVPSLRRPGTRHQPTLYELMEKLAIAREHPGAFRIG